MLKGTGRINGICIGSFYSTKISRNDSQAEQVLYGKGVILLNALEQKMGKNKFLELCKARIDKKVTNTEDVLKLIHNISGKEIADWFEQSLKTR